MLISFQNKKSPPQLVRQAQVRGVNPLNTNNRLFLALHEDGLGLRRGLMLSALIF